MTSSDPDQPSSAPEQAPDPFDQRPLLVFRAGEAALTAWGILVSLGVMLALIFVAAIAVALARHLELIAAICSLLALLAVAVLAHSLANPPSSIALNLDTRRYHLRKGSGRFRRNILGPFSDVLGVRCVTDESSHGVSGYRVVILVGPRMFPCVVEDYGPGGEKKAQDRTQRLAEILGVSNLTEVSQSRRI